MTIVAPQSAPDDEYNRPGRDGFDRVPPNDIDAEQSTVGAQLLSKDAIADVLDTPLQQRDYYRPAHEIIQAAILFLYGKGEPVDPITVAAELTKRGDITKVGGAPYLHTLVQTVPTAANASYYAEIVHERAVRRRLIEASTRITQVAYSGEGDIDDVRSAVEAEVLDALATREQSAGYAYVREDVPDFWDQLDARMKGTGKMTGIPTGFLDLDAMTNGLQPGQLVVIGARPAMGKSTLALDIARSASIKHGLTSAFFSLEMGRAEITQRLYSAESQVALHHIRAGSVTEVDLDRMAKRTPAIEGSALIVDDSPNLSLTEIRSRARRIKQAKGGLDLLIVDYLQLMQSGATGRRQENRQQEVSDMSRNLKLLAKELEIPVIALSQLNRGPEQRTDKRPQISELRESGSIEQDADMVILLHREDAYEKESPRAGEADLIVAKHRNGPTSTVTVAFQGHYSRFVDMAANIG
ncbi:replicative DNA helicase [Streptomyces sp. 021-4]|uniref:replicative DNA helicase n=1 Tax=Streptomyces sp. 021-4 TaxID=2789260 RepID=UPI0039F53D09